MILNATYSGPARRFENGLEVREERVSGAFLVVHEDRYVAILDSGQADEVTWVVDHDDFEGRATVYH